MIFMTRPHKEERFLFPVYPLLYFAVAYGMQGLEVGTQEGREGGCCASHGLTLLSCAGAVGLPQWAAL